MMNFNKNIALALSLLLFSLSSCQFSQKSRRPISHSSGTFMKKSAARNKKLIASEEMQITSIIKEDTKTKFYTSSKGYWYSYALRNTQDTVRPKKGDIAFFEYEIKDLKGNSIYSKSELGSQKYNIDKENIMTGLREGLKIMHKKETINFFFTSHLAYGYHGDNKKIGTNQPILCVVTLHDFMSEIAYNKMKSAEIAKKTIAPKIVEDTLTKQN